MNILYFCDIILLVTNTDDLKKYAYDRAISSVRAILSTYIVSQIFRNVNISYEYILKGGRRMKFSEKVYYLRKRRNLTQEQLAKLANV